MQLQIIYYGSSFTWRPRCHFALSSALQLLTTANWQTKKILSIDIC